MLILSPVLNISSSALLFKGNLEMICFVTFTLPEIPLALKLNSPALHTKFLYFLLLFSSISTSQQTLSPLGLTSVDL